MKKGIGCMFLLLCLAGCIVEQKQPMGANSDRTQGFSGYGVLQARAWEGPLTDLMVPDSSPKGLTDPTQSSLGEGNFSVEKRNLNLNHQGINRQGSRITSHKPGILRDKQIQSDEPYLKSNQSNRFTNQPVQDIATEIERKLKLLEHVHDVHVVSDGEIYVIGVESNEGDRKKLYRSVKKEVNNIVHINRVRITTNRRLINRMKALEHHVDIGHNPFGGTIAEIVDIFETNSK
ncbi:YhcN/YlaJ family sporulation lipoprotein [Bacillus solitudinis]|uniref:YhcN/YlaJ family sporulation lipoprotein n=1 Tax=Bacillus solitudinis TaxID=2014074 RepID=UPI000C238B26|nr:YhcN/YlaJ family sporulation lipoprotein [Bacillus solitudinis]